MDRALLELAILQIFFLAIMVFGMLALKNKRLQDFAPFFHSSGPEVGSQDDTSFFSHPENGRDALGLYGGTPIYRFVDIEGKPYIFDRLLLSGDLVIMERGERCVAPGLVYREYRPTLA